MIKVNYYEEIKNELINNILTKKAKDYSKNKSDLMHYYNVGKLLIEAQGGEERAHYGDVLIKEYSKRLTSELSKGYDPTTLKRMRKFYLIVQKGAPLEHLLSWSHYKILIVFSDINKITYYINESVSRNLSKRELQSIIKTNEYERLDIKTKNKLILEYSSDSRIFSTTYELV